MANLFKRIKFILREESILYPYLIAILFLINEMRKNAAFYTLKENIYLILIVLSFTCFIDFLSRKLVKNRIKAGLISLLFIVVNLFYQDILRKLSNQKILLELINSLTNHPQRIIISLLFLILLICIIIILKTSEFSRETNLYFNVTILAFIFVEIVKWACFPIPQVRLVENVPFIVKTSLRTEQKPDIYYIILDACTSSESLKTYWNYDNSAFEDSLKEYGFFIAKKSRTDYTSTSFCTASNLNSSSLLLDTSKHYNEQNLFKLIRTNRLFNWLSSNGYICYNYSHFDISGSKKILRSFNVNHYLGRTLWYTIMMKYYYTFYPNTKISQTNLEIFKQITNLSKERRESPVFVYAHVMMPHSPYSFNEKGLPLNESDSLTEKQKYFGQLIFTDSLTLNLVKQILINAKNAPIIIIHGDHGFRYLEDTTKIEKEHEAHTIFYALYSPNGFLITDTINPMNTFKKLIEKINN